MTSQSCSQTLDTGDWTPDTPNDFIGPFCPMLLCIGQTIICTIVSFQPTWRADWSKYYVNMQVDKQLYGSKRPGLGGKTTTISLGTDDAWQHDTTT